MAKGNNKIAVLDYNTATVDIITVSENEIAKYGGVETYLTEHCNYNLDEISYMDCVQSVDNYTSDEIA